MGRIRQRLDIPQQRAKTPHLVTNHRGTRLNSTGFAKVWKKAVDQAGIPHDLLHGAAFLRRLGLDHRGQSPAAGQAHGPCVKANGVRVCGNYVEGLEEDAEAIYHYFGQDFIMPRKKESPIPFRYSTGHSPGIGASNFTIPLSFNGAGNGIRKLLESSTQLTVTH